MSMITFRRFSIIVVVSLFAFNEGNAKTNDWSKRIVSKTHHPLSSFINPHVSDINILIIDGRRFEHVRGVKKFYLPVPGTNAVVFVVDEKGYSITYHVFNMDTGEDVAIHARDSVFGESIGFSNQEDSVEAGRDGKIVLCNRSGPNVITKTLIELDIERKAIVSEKTFYYNKEGKVIDEYDHIPPF